MQIPPFVYSLAFWQALCYLVAALVAYFTSWKLEAGVLLAVSLAVLKLFQIAPQIRSRARAERLAADLADQLAADINRDH